MWFYLLALAVILCFIDVLLNYNETARLLRKIPGPKMHFIVGNSLEVLRDSPVELMKLGRQYAKIYDGIYRMYFFPVASVFIYNPEDVEIITSNIKHSDKSIVYNFLKPFLREGLLISNGSKWQERRKILTPAFHFNILRQFSEIIVENSQRLLDTLNQTVGQPIDIVPVISEFTLNSICETAMGTRLDEDKAGSSRLYKEAVYKVGYNIIQRFMKSYLYNDFIYNLSSVSRELNKHLKIVHRFTEQVIRARKGNIDQYGLDISNVDDETWVYKKKRKAAMLDLLISAEKEGLIDEHGIQEEVDTFMFEGHDTTASGLTFCLMLLANYKNSQDKIVAELREIFEDWNRPIKMEDLPKMKYMECCIKESMRLYPPVHFISRKLNETVVLSNYTVPAGTYCHITINDLHRRPNIYKNPDAFDPDRFLPENSVGRHPYAYIPFSAGPRNCIGQKFAMMEMKVAIAGILREFELVPFTRHEDIQYTADLVMRNDGPVRVTFIKRY